MFLKLVELIFPLIMFFLSAISKNGKWSFLNKFKGRIHRSISARKFMILIFDLFLILYHYIYLTNANVITVGFLISSIICTIMPVYSISHNLLIYINRTERRFVNIGVLIMALAFVPGLYTLAFTLCVFLLVSSLYPLRTQITDLEASSTNRMPTSECKK